MRASFRIGRIAGVPVGVNWSVLVIFGLIAWALSAQQFPAAYPGRPGWQYVLAGLSAAVGAMLALISTSSTCRHRSCSTPGCPASTAST